MTNEFRAMCAELANAYEHELNKRGMGCDLIIRARALLAQPVVEGPTDDELWALGSDDFCANCWPTDAIAYARAVLARWGNPTPQPVVEGPVSDSGMSAYNYRAEARFKKLDHLEVNINFAEHDWKSTPKGLQWLKLMDEQLQDEYESGL